MAHHLVPSQTEGHSEDFQLYLGAGVTLNSGKALEEETYNKGTQDRQATHNLSLLPFNFGVLLN